MRKCFVGLCFATIFFGITLSIWAQDEIKPDLHDISEPFLKAVILPLHRGIMTDNGATPWYSSIEVGNPPQKIKFMIDTGTSNNWLTSDTCTTKACMKHDRFNAQRSKTFKNLSDPQKDQTINLGPWGVMKGHVGMDGLALERKGRIFFQRMNLFLADYYNGSQFEGLACDGGIAIPSSPSAHENRSELLILLKHYGRIDATAASFWFDIRDQKGACVLGGMDRSKYDEKTLQFIKAKDSRELKGTGLESLWVITLQSFDYGDKRILQDIPFILDTGSSRFKGDPAFIAKLKSAITQNGKFTDTLIGKNPDFSDYQNVILTIHGKGYVLKPRQYFLEVTPGVWKLAFHPMKGLEGYLLVGSVFLDSIYSTFYFHETDSLRLPFIGLADRK